MVVRAKSRQPDRLGKLLVLPVYTTIPFALVQHGQAVPLGVMVRGTLEWMLDEQTLEQLFEDHAPEQYTRELTLGTLVSLLIQVSAGTRASVYAAYQADQAQDEPAIATSYQALYGKLGRLNPEVSAALVRHSADRCGRLLVSMPRARAEPLPGYRLRVLDGNVLAGTTTASRRYGGGSTPACPASRWSCTSRGWGWSPTWCRARTPTPRNGPC